MNTQSISDLVTVVSAEVPLDTTTVYVEATKLKKSIISSVYDVSNLVGISFLTSNG